MADVLKNVTTTAATLPAVASKPAREPDEVQLVCASQRGDAAAYEELVRRHRRRVFALASSILRRREDAEDAAQQVFTKAYFSLPRFDLRSAFSTWLYKITANECWDQLRRRRARPQLLEADLTEEQARRLERLASDTEGKGAEEHVVLCEIAESLLSQLSSEDRQLFVLKEVEGFSVKEVSEILGLNVNTVKVRLFRARARLMSFAGKNGISRVSRPGRKMS